MLTAIQDDEHGRSVKSVSTDIEMTDGLIAFVNDQLYESQVHSYANCLTYLPVMARPFSVVNINIYIYTSTTRPATTATNFNSNGDCMHVER